MPVLNSGYANKKHNIIFYDNKKTIFERINSNQITFVLCTLFIIFFSLAQAGDAFSKNDVGFTIELTWSHEEELNKAFHYLEDLGVGWVRASVRWQSIEQAPGEYNWEMLDYAVEEITKRGLNLLLILEATPRWLVDWDEVGEGWVEAYYPKDLGPWESFVIKIATRYKEQVTYWQIRNEVNIIEFARPKPNPEVYYNNLKIAYNALKEVNPENQVMLAAMSINGVRNNPWSGYTEINYLPQLYDLGAADYFDILALNTYDTTGEGVDCIIELIEEARAVMVKHGDEDTSIWITEIGYPVQTFDTVNFIRDLFKRLPQEVKYVDKVIWYNLLDTNHDGYGLIDRQYEPKFTYNAFKTAMNNL